MTIGGGIRPRVSIAEYLAMEEAATEKHILWDGDVRCVGATAGWTFDHGTISANVIAALGNSLRGSQCRVLSSDMKVWIPRREGFVYPDATVVSGRAELYPRSTHVLVNPSLIVEVLSEGTEKFDRGDKFEGYRSIDTLRHYVMVSSKHRLVEHYERAEGGAWTLREYGPGGELRVKGPDAVLAVDELYRMAFEDDAG